jgi:hypothetical protein
MIVLSSPTADAAADRKESRRDGADDRGADNHPGDLLAVQVRYLRPASAQNATVKLTSATAAIAAPCQSVVPSQPSMNSDRRAASGT